MGWGVWLWRMQPARLEQRPVWGICLHRRLPFLTVERAREHPQACRQRVREPTGASLQRHCLGLSVGCGAELLDRLDHLLTAVVVNRKTKRDGAFGGA